MGGLAKTEGLTCEHDAAEVAALERCANGVRDAFGARRVYAGSVEDGFVQFRASSPVDAGVLTPWDVESVGGLAEILGTGVIAHGDGVPTLPGIESSSTLVPLVSRGCSVGLLVIDWGPDGVPPATAVLALVGSQTGLALDALRHCGELAHEAASYHDASALLEGVLGVIPQAVKVLDLDGRVLHWNRGCEQLYGTPAEEVLGERMPHIPEDMRLRAIQDIRRIAASGRTATREVFAVRADGSAVALGLTAAPFLERDGHPAGIVSVATELSEDTGIVGGEDDLVVSVTQSLKGPLAAIVGFAQLLARPEILEEPARRARTIRALEERGNRMAAVIDDLLLVTSIQEGGLRVVPEVCELSSLVTCVVSRFEEEHPEKRLVIEYDESIPALLLDRCRVDQAIGNLLDAAARHSTTERDVRLAVALREGNVVVEAGVVGKDGGGDASEPNSQTAGERNIEEVENESRGAKLGLYLVRMIAEAHGGDASASGEPGRERAFAMRIPVRCPPA